MPVPPYHSVNPSDPDVYHVYNDCVSGKQIPQRNRRAGTNNYRKCTHCATR